MGIKTYRPYTPSRRQMTGSDFSEITKTTPEKSLLAPKSRQAGRNNQGKINSLIGMEISFLLRKIKIWKQPWKI